MTDPHVPRHPLIGPFQLLLGRLPGPRRQAPTPTRSGHRVTTPTPAATRPLSPKQYEVLQAVADGRIQRDLLLGTFEPHLLDGQDVIWTLRTLVIRRLVQLQPIGPPRLTDRGRRKLDSPD